MEKVADGVFAFFGDNYECNSYLLAGERKVVVDTGTGFHFAGLEQALKRQGVSVKQVDAVVNTHCHVDHIGGNRFFYAPIYAFPPDSAYIASADPEFTCSTAFGMTLEESNDVHELKTFDGWEVLHTPGHTQGSVCLLRDGVLISGDTLFAEGVGRTDLPGGNAAALEASLTKLKKTKYDLLLPGHGPVKEI